MSSLNSFHHSATPLNTSMPPFASSITEKPAKSGKSAKAAAYQARVAASAGRGGRPRRSNLVPTLHQIPLLATPSGPDETSIRSLRNAGNAAAMWEVPRAADVRKHVGVPPNLQAVLARSPPAHPPAHPPVILRSSPALFKETYDSIMEKIANDCSEHWVIKYIRDTNGTAKKLQNVGRFLPRIVGPYVNVFRTFYVGVAVDGAPNPSKLAREIKEFKDYGSGARRDYIVAYNALITHFPCLKRMVPGLQRSVDEVEFFTDFLDTHARAARSDDLAALRYEIIDMLEDVDLPNGIKIKKFPRADRNKANRGFMDPCTGRLLISRGLRENFDKDPRCDFNRLVLRGKIFVLSGDYPSYLYSEENHIEGKTLSGILEGPLLVQCYRRIFTGKSTALADPGIPRGASRKCVAAKNDMTRVTPASIAYVACLVRFCLSAQTEWCVTDGDFSYETYYGYLVELFDDADFAVPVLKWWNRMVFGVTTEHEIQSDGEDTYLVTRHTETAASKVRAERKARLAAKAAAEAAIDNAPLSPPAAPFSAFEDDELEYRSDQDTGPTGGYAQNSVEIGQGEEEIDELDE
ncbi:hypothetical protein A0H81_05168 [Grifola frondosa]|uniref:Uncharacterized protein n=1 Tax=Grifola frondosa TaxID=5627 RepID=A0A1C7MDC9_GRIFR|nr:hypothetical protein A0H81_05168 [Grifola frondosa]